MGLTRLAENMTGVPICRQVVLLNDGRAAESCGMLRGVGGMWDVFPVCRKRRRRRRQGIRWNSEPAQATASPSDMGVDNCGMMWENGKKCAPPPSFWLRTCLYPPDAGVNVEI